MNKNIVALAALAAVGLCSSVSQAENRAGTIAITPFVGGYTFDGMQQLDPSMLFGVRAGYNITNRFGVEGLFESAPDVENDLNAAKMLNYRMEVLYNLFPNNKFVPFLAAGYGGSRIKFTDNDVNHPHETRYAGVVSYGLGAKYFLNDNFALRADARQIVIYRDPVNYNYEYTLGASFLFGSTKATPAPVEPVSTPQAVEPVATAPAIAPTTTTNPPACNLNVSPASITKGNTATLNWTSTNTSECSIIPDIGAVKTNGSMTVSPSESTNYTLTCSGTGGSTATSLASLSVSQPTIAVVSPPADSDMDGVPDSIDKCPKTPAGGKVDNSGCTPVSACKNESLNILFDFDKAQIKTKYHEILKQFATKLKSFPGATTVIEGHTDSVGTESYNIKLSQRRADAARKYFIDQQGIAANRITTKALGETKPLSSNDSAEGRRNNRRVESLFICP
jgi:OOP family OmpA-OmpF porin